MAKVMIYRPVLEQIQTHLTVGHEVSFFYVWDDFQDFCFDKKLLVNAPKGIKVFEYKKENKKPFEFIHCFKSAIAESGAEIILVNGLRDLPAINLVAKLIPVYKRPMIIAISHNPLVWQSRVQRLINAIYIKTFSDGYVALSSLIRDQLISLGIPENKIAFIPNASEIDQTLINNEACPDSKKTIVYLSNIEPRKGHDVLLKAFYKVQSNFPDLKCILIGRTKDEEFQKGLEALIKDLKLEDKVVFTGWLSHPEALRFVANCSVFVFPSFSEMMPRAVIEALLLGKPVIASKVDGIIDIIQNNYSGILIEPGDINGLTESLLSLLRDPKKALSLGLNGRSSITGLCSMRSVGNAYNAFYEKLLELRLAE